MFLFSFFSWVAVLFMIMFLIEPVCGMSGFPLQASSHHISQQCFIDCLLFLSFIQIFISETLQVCLKTLYGFHYIRIHFYHQFCFLGGGIQLSLSAVALLSVHDMNYSFKILQLQIFNNKKFFC